MWGGGGGGTVLVMWKEVSGIFRVKYSMIGASRIA